MGMHGSAGPMAAAMAAAAAPGRKSAVPAWMREALLKRQAEQAAAARQAETAAATAVAEQDDAGAGAEQAGARAGRSKCAVASCLLGFARFCPHLRV